MQLRTIVKSVLPFPVLRFLRAAHRDHVFRRGMRRFLQDPESCAQCGNTVVNDLIYGWGNEGWSASDEYLASCIEHALHTKGPILECGSGLSTILIGIIAKRRRITHWALEHSPEWAAKTQRYLRLYEIDSVFLCVKPLSDCGNFCWYDPPMESMPESFTLVICDGPPATTKGGRQGLVPVMGTRLATGSVILLDDAVRAHECVVARQWGRELGTYSEFYGHSTPYIKLIVGSVRLQTNGTDRPSG